MAIYSLPYDRATINLNVDEKLVNAVLTGTPFGTPVKDQHEAVLAAMKNPYGGKTLEALARGKGSATIIISDHTRPVPSRYIIPHMLAELRRGNPAIDVTLLVATGCHRGTTKEELTEKLGEDIVATERIAIHDCEDTGSFVELGKLPSGATLIVNRLAAETDLLVSEGFIEPHFFAGFSGGRKSVLPGVCSRVTVLGNHCAAFIADPGARAGSLDANPIHRDMIAAAKMAKLAYIVNVVNDEEKRIAGAFAGDPDQAHAAGCAFLLEHCRVPAVQADIAITTNGGYPLDQDVYQSVKGMTAAEACAGEDGVIIIAAACRNGAGGDHFYRALRDSKSPTEMLRRIAAVPQDKTPPDQWEYQILARVLEKHPVILVNDWDPVKVEEMGIRHAGTMEEAVAMARAIKGDDARFTIIPDGVSVIPVNP